MYRQVEVEISGNNVLAGKLIDMGLDLLVLFHETQYYYIPLVHVQNIKACPHSDEEDIDPGDKPIDCDTDTLSFRKILNQAKGMFVELFVSGNKPIHGYLTSIMNDYFVFYSPVYKGMFISMNHLKWLIPFPPALTPYTLSNQALPVHPVQIPLSRTFEEQCRKLAGNIVVFDLGDNPDKIGLLHKGDGQMIELVNGKGDKIDWNLQHIKTVYVP